MKYESSRPNANPDKPWEMLPSPKNYGHLKNNPLFRNFKRDSKANRRMGKVGKALNEKKQGADNRKGKK